MLASHATANSLPSYGTGGLSCVRGTRSGLAALRGALARSGGRVRPPYRPDDRNALAGSGAPARGRLAGGRDARSHRADAASSMLTACRKGTMTRQEYVEKRLAMLQARIIELEGQVSQALAATLASMAARDGAGQATDRAGQADSMRNFTNP